MHHRIFKIFFLFPISVYLIFFSIYNHQSVKVIFLPSLFDEKDYSVTLPFYVSIYSSLLLGILLGGFAAWVRQSRYRVQARIGAKDSRYWRLEAERLVNERDKYIQANTEKFLKIHQKTSA